MKLHVLRADEVGLNPGHPHLRTRGGVRSRVLSPEAFPLWMVETEMDPGAVLSWDGAPSDEAVYLRSGELEIGGLTCPAGGAVVLEAGARTEMRANLPVTMLHGGSSEPPADHEGGERVHVLGPQGRWRTARGDEVTATWYVDGTCPTCSVQLFRVRHGGTRGERRGLAHHHSQDEIIHLLSGTVRLGAHQCGPGSTLSIPAGLGYAITGGPDGHEFLNFRAAVSHLSAVGSVAHPVLETAMSQAGVETGGWRADVAPLTH